MVMADTPAEPIRSHDHRMNSVRGASTLRVLAMVTLVLSILAGWGARIQSHCLSHEPSTPSAAEHDHNTSAHFPGATWASQNDHDCEHCPPSGCSRVAPCSGSASVALTATVLPLAELVAHAVALPNQFDPEPLGPFQPPTPPPQMVS